MDDDARIRVGDRVSVLYGSRFIDAEVIEDRGPLGASGDRVLRVAWVPTGSDDRLEFEVPASQVRPRGSSFESRVREILRRLSLTFEQSTDSARDAPDFIIHTPRGLLLVEAKSFPRGAS